MKLFDFYKSVEKISYKHYEINHFQNILTLEAFEQIAKTLNDNCIPFAATGGLGFTFYSKKCYRTFKDVDMLIEGRDLLKVMYLLKNSFNIYKPIEKTIEEVIEDFEMQSNTKDARNAIVLESIDSKVKLEIYNYDRQSYDYSIFFNKVHVLNLDNTLYHYVLPSKIMFKNVWDRQKDIDDIKIHMINIPKLVI